MPKQKIVHIITGLNQGGAETVLFRLASNLSNYDHKIISLCSIDNSELASLFKKKGIDVISLNMGSCNIFPIFSILKLKKLLQTEQPAIVQTWMYHANLVGGLAGRLAGIKNVVWNIRNGALEKNGEHGKSLNLRTKIGWIVKLGSWFSKRIPLKIICCSTRASEIHKKWGYADKFHIIHNGIDVNEFRPDPAGRLKIREKLNIDSNTKLVGLIGRFHPQKDISTFLKAANLICQNKSDIRFVLVGTGITQDNSDLSHEIDHFHLNNNIHLLGKRQDIVDILNALDVFVSSSIFGEAFPNVLPEAMACGIPCVATDVGESAYILGGAGKVVSPSSYIQMAKGIVEMLESSCPSEEIRGRIVEHFPIEKMVKEYDGFYKELLPCFDKQLIQDK